MLFAFLFGSLKNDFSGAGVSRGTFTWKTDSFMTIDSNQIKWSFGFHLDVSRMVMSSSSSSSSPPSSPFFPSLVGLQVIWLHTMSMCPNMYCYAMAHLIIVCALIHECMEAMPSIIPFQNMSVHHTRHILCVKYHYFRNVGRYLYIFVAIDWLFAFLGRHFSCRSWLQIQLSWK